MGKVPGCFPEKACYQRPCLGKVKALGWRGGCPPGDPSGRAGGPRWSLGDTMEGEPGWGKHG